MLAAIQIVCITALSAYLALVVIVGRNPRSREPRALLPYLTVMLIWQFSVTAVVFSSSKQDVLFWYRILIGVGSSIGVFYALFVREFLDLRKNSWFIGLGFVLTAMIAIWTLSGQPGVFGDMYKDIYWLNEFGELTYIFGVVTYTYMGYGVVSLVIGYRRTTSVLKRNRIKYLLFGVSLVFIGSLINFNESLKVYPIDIVANVANALIIAFAILKYQLLDISLVARRGLFYSIPAAIIGTGYLFTIFLAVNFFNFVTGYHILLLSLVMAGITAVVLQPLWAILQDRLDRLFFREKHDANLMLQRLSRTVSAVLDIDRLASMILSEITDTLHISTGALILQEHESGYYILMAEVGLDSGTSLRLRPDNPIVEWLSVHGETLTRHQTDLWAQFKAMWAWERKDLDTLGAEIFVPLIVRQELIGMLMLGPKKSEIAYTRDERMTLLALANQTAMAVQIAWLYQSAIEARDRAEIILQQAFAGTIVVDEGLHVISVNPAAEHITKYDADDLIGTPIADVFGRTLTEEGGVLMAALGTQSPVVPVETTLASRFGERDILLGVTELHDGYLLNFTDITHFKDVDRLKSNIVANVSHELRTPLASIKGYTELLMDGFEGDDQQLRHQFLSVIDEETDRLNAFINDLLDLSRLESGQVVPNLDLLYLDEIIERTTHTLDIQARKLNIELVLSISDNMQPILADRHLMRSVVRNLISNAIKYSSKDMKVEVNLTQEGNTVLFSVIDQGVGIPPEDVPYVFTKFYRASTAEQAGIMGTGLGLALVKEAVDIHGGSCEVESTLGEGTCVTIRLPIAEDEIVLVEGEMALNAA